MMKYILLSVCFIACISTITAQTCGAAQSAVNEGNKLCCYKDTKGIPTIGVGFNLQSGQYGTILKQYGINVAAAIAECGKPANQKKQCFKSTADSTAVFQKMVWPSVLSCAQKFAPGAPSNVVNAFADVAMAGCGTLNSFDSVKAFVNKKDWAGAGARLKQLGWCKQVGGRCARTVACLTAAGGAKSGAPVVGASNSKAVAQKKCDDACKATEVKDCASEMKVKKTKTCPTALAKMKTCYNHCTTNAKSFLSIYENLHMNVDSESISDVEGQMDSEVLALQSELSTLEHETENTPVPAFVNVPATTAAPVAASPVAAPVAAAKAVAPAAAAAVPAAATTSTGRLTLENLHAQAVAEAAKVIATEKKEAAASDAKAAAAPSGNKALVRSENHSKAAAAHLAAAQAHDTLAKHDLEITELRTKLKAAKAARAALHFNATQTALAAHNAHKAVLKAHRKVTTTAAAFKRRRNARKNRKNRKSRKNRKNKTKSTAAAKKQLFY